jgi:hypothetical protein
MRTLKCFCAVLVLTVSTAAQSAPTAAQRGAQTTAGPQPTRAAGEVVSVDANARQIRLKTDDGRQLSLQLDDATDLRRVPPGAAHAAQAERIALAQVAVGDRVFARGTTNADGQSFAARQVFVSSSAAAAQAAAAARMVAGRITALKPDAKEIALLARTADGRGRQVTINAAGPQVRFLRIAPDSLNPRDAVPASFAALQVGDQLRATGEPNADSTRLAAEEIISGSILRVAGTVASVNAATNELTINVQPGGQAVTVVAGPRSQLRRIPPETAATFERTRAAGTRQNDARSTDNKAANKTTMASPRPSGQTMQELFRSLPVVTAADLKKGDAVLVTGTPGADATHLTAIILLTGEAGFLGRLQQMAPRDGQNASPGLPGDVLGGGVPAEPRDPRDPPP